MEQKDNKNNNKRKREKSFVGQLVKYSDKYSPQITQYILSPPVDLSPLTPLPSAPPQAHP